MFEDFESEPGYLLISLQREMAITGLILRPRQQCWTALCTSYLTTGTKLSCKCQLELCYQGSVFLFFFRFRFVETDGKGYDRVRRTEIGKKNFKLTHFEEVSFKFFTTNKPVAHWFHLDSGKCDWVLSCQVFTSHHWMVRIYKLKPQKNRIRGRAKKLKLVSTSGTYLL